MIFNLTLSFYNGTNLKTLSKSFEFWRIFLIRYFSFPLRNFPHRRPPRPTDDGAEILSVEGG